ncbi:MAG TPA: DUF1801 domain-containing protein [Chloroflexia bacterium]|nr:DUF1801 domain-containing protein [Chloroflexia bacterium]
MTVEEFLAPFSPTVRELAMRTRELVRSTLPSGYEGVHPGRNSIIYGTSGKMVDWICYISPLKSRINLGFLRGGELPDPEGLLEGTGKLLRHVKIRQVEDIEKPAIKALLVAAVEAMK